MRRQSFKVLGFLAAYPQGNAIIFGEPVPAEGEFDLAAQHRQRGAEFMRGVGHEIGDLLPLSYLFGFCCPPRLAQHPGS